MNKAHFFRIILIICLYSTFIPNDKLNAQYIEYAFRHISTTDGLSNVTVLSIAQDKQGFMWFGTMDGLNRFDGEQIKVYREDPEESFSLGSSYIWSVLCTPDSNIWVGTARGLFLYDFIQDNFNLISIKNSNGDPINMIVRSLFQQNDILWIGTVSGVFMYDLKNERFIAFDGKTEYRKQIGTVHCFLTLESDELWVGTAQGLFRQSGKNLISVQLSEYADRNLIVRSITPGRNSPEIFGSTSGRPSTRASKRATSPIRDAVPVPTLNTRPATSELSSASRFAAATSLTWTKSRLCRLSSKIIGEWPLKMREEKVEMTPV